MRRSDIASVRLTLDKGAQPIEFKIIHVDLYFFFDIDIAILALEVAADDTELGVAQEALFRFGRAYPAYWEPDRRGGHCPWLVEWLSPTGEVLARLREARKISVIRLSASRSGRGRALGIPAFATGAPSQRPAGAHALPPA
jgi:hypothetical protein